MWLGSIVREGFVDIIRIFEAIAGDGGVDFGLRTVEFDIFILDIGGRV